ncbi:zinc finger protein 518A [Spea bombifrons]|uniref:zinc finger protein 518A n=1 Tax=Spea bombifrons TaxID=233779 RepID=UPI00234A4114|nr:zinc finger protein 518A [Spea bombifrons]
MRSPNKDCLMDTEDSAPAKDDFWDFGRHGFGTSEPNSNPSLSLSEADEKVNSCKKDNEEQKMDQVNEKVQKPPCRKQTARKSLYRENQNSLGRSEEPNAEHKSEPQVDDDAVNMSAKVLHFFCQKCNNGIRYSPNDLQKHFEISHNGELPLYPCEMCNFSANDFQVFKQHRITHRSALVKCEICNNDYLYTLLGLTKHFSVMHCVNGHFNCSKCKFSTRDVGTFVQHIHRHNGIEYACQKCNHISFSRIEFQKHLQGHSTMFPFSCRYCNYSAMRKDFIVKHVLAKHREHVHTKDELVEEAYNAQMAQTAAGLKLLLKKYQTDSPNKALWKKDNNNVGVEKASEDIQSTSSFPYKSKDESQVVKEFTQYNNYEQATRDEISSVTTIKCNSEDGSLLQNAVHGPTVLMVKNNKITVPANYCATFMGYKMVNGKQNLVIKLLPSNKQGANALKAASPSTNSMSRVPQSPGRSSIGIASNGADNRPASQLFNYRSTSSVASLDRFSSSAQSRSQPATPTSFITRRNQSPISMKLGSATSQAFFESIRKDLRYHGMPNSSSATDIARHIKEEPEEYSVSEQQNRHSESTSGQPNPSSGPSYLKGNSKVENLYRLRHNSETSGQAAANLFTKDKELRNPALYKSAAGSLAHLSKSNLKSKNDFIMRNVLMSERQERLMDKPERDNMTFMPRITSVFSLQNRTSDCPSSPKNTYLHSMLQENKKINDKVYHSKAQSPVASSNTFTSAKQSQSTLASTFAHRVSNGDGTQKGNVANSALLKQERDSPGSSFKTQFSLSMGELVKSHTENIANERLAKEKMSGIVKTPTSSSGLQLLRSSQSSSVSETNKVLHPSSSSQFISPVLPTSQSGFKMVSSSNSVGASNRVNAPITMNTKPGMVLTFSNGHFGAIKNISNATSQEGSSFTGPSKLPLPRLLRPPVPQAFKNVFRDVGKTSNHVSSNFLSGSAAKNPSPNLNLLQYCVNSIPSNVTAENFGSAGKPQESFQKQPVYAVLPDGKQAVLLNYVLPNNHATVPKRKLLGGRVVHKLLPKTNEDLQQNASLNKNGPIPITSIKKEDADSANGYPEPSNSLAFQGSGMDQKPTLRSSSSLASAGHLFSTQNDKFTLPSSSANAKAHNLKTRQHILNSLNTQNRSLKRKASLDSGLCRVDPDIKDRAPKKKSETLPEPPRKKMLHRKCKEKNGSIDVDSVVDLGGPKPVKEVVRTLRLCPLSSSQLVKCPQQNQPVVVLNHPDVDTPEIINVMNMISKFKGQILNVSLSKRTLEALLESRSSRSAEGGYDGLPGRRHRRAKPVSPVKERFVLKLTLKKTSKNNYKIVKNTPVNKLKTKFNCWFCGRIFDNQDKWVGHGQRHLMEATKDWNTLF